MSSCTLYVQVVAGSSLEATLTELQGNSEKAFLSTLQSQVKQQLLERVDAPPADLSPSPGIPPLLALLREIISIASVADGRQDEINKVIRLQNLIIVNFQFEVAVNVMLSGNFANKQSKLTL